METRTWLLSLVILASCCLVWQPPSLLGQTISAVDQAVVSGTVLSRTNHSLEVRIADDGIREVFFQDREIEAITLGGDRALVQFPATIAISGTVEPTALRRDLAIRILAQMQRDGTVESVDSIQLLSVQFNQFDVAWSTDPPPDGQSSAKVEIHGLITRITDEGITVRVPKSRATGKTRLKIPLSTSQVVEVRDTSMREVQPGDRIRDCQIIQFSTGEWIARTLNVELAPGHQAVQMDPDDQFQVKHRHLDDQPQPPREVRSAHFIINTDLSDRSAQILLDKLETMFQIVGKYYNRRNLGQPIYCYVVDDLDRWEGRLQELAPGLEHIRAGAGVTQSLVGVRASRVYSCGKHDVVQHECVHAFCHLAFGSTGPTWYAEGMAELGCYWRPGDQGVNIDPVVIRYLTSATPTPLVELVAPGQITGDSWRAYAWRWALCYMLVNNPNYQQRFYALGDAMMRPNSRANFYNVFADVAPEISFEYRQFTQHVGNGYRQELCSWDWKTRPIGLNSGRTAKAQILAKGGWQATSAKLEKGKQYQAFSRGEWSMDGQATVTTDGDAQKTGALIGAILYQATDQQGKVREFHLSKPFVIGQKLEFNSSHSGHLYVRCQEKMTQLADNQGKVEVAIREAR